MLNDNDYKVIDNGVGYTIGELLRPHSKLEFLRTNALVSQFDGLDNMLNFITTNMKEPKNGKSSSDVGGGGFHFYDTYEEAMGIFRNKPQTVVKFDQSELRIKDANESGTTVDYDVVGDYIDMGRYMEGVPESWGSMRNGNARNRRVNIMINLNQWHGVDAKDITHRGERTLRLVDALEAGGVRTQLTAIEATECGYTEVKLKRHEEPLTISDLAVVSHPEFLRRIIFRVNEYSRTWQGGYGSARDFSEKLSRHPDILHTDNNDEMNILIDSNMQGKEYIDRVFDELERLLIWEMSKPIPEVDAVKIDHRGIYFNPNGSRPDDEVKREGLEAINEK